MNRWCRILDIPTLPWAPSRRRGGWLAVSVLVIGAATSTWVLVAAPAAAQVPPPDPKPAERRGQEGRPSDGQPHEEGLTERLIREAASAGDEDVMDEVLRLMEDVSYRLEITFDAGSETQGVQQRLTERLDEAILSAALQRRSGGDSQAPSPGDERREQRGPGQRSDTRADGAASDPAAASRSTAAAGAGAAGLRGDAALRENRRAWGLLPPRQREEVLQGSSEAYLEQYRAWIERYYRALQESEGE